MVKKIHEIFDIEKGQRLIKINRQPGKTRLITAGKTKQGIKMTINALSSGNKIFNENCITVDMFGNCFYRDYEFVADDNIHILYFKKAFIKSHKKLFISCEKKTIYLYFLPILNFLFSKKYGYGRQVRIERLKKERIKINLNKISDSRINMISKLNIFLDKEKIIKSNFLVKKMFQKKIFYKYFNIETLFTISGTKTTQKKNVIPYGDYRYITTSNRKNGFTSYSINYTEEKNIITIDSATDGAAFYQDNKFVASDHVEKLVPKFDMNKYHAMYFVTILNHIKRTKYSYSRKRSQKRIRKERLLLPVNSKNQLDLIFIEDYIKNMKFSKMI